MAWLSLSISSLSESWALLLSQSVGFPLLSLTTSKLSLLGIIRILLIPTALGSEIERICFQELVVNERTKLTDTRGEYHPNEISKRMHLLVCKLSFKWLDLCRLDLPLTLLLEL